MLILNKKSKLILAAVIFILLAAAGTLVERLEKDAFMMETVATEDAVSYQSGSEEEIDGKININSAGSVELEKLDGIGAALAQRIIDYREENGPYISVEEIMKVSGISEKKFEAIKNSICAE